MKGKLTLQKRLILPILLLGLVMLLSNILAVFSIHNVNANAVKIVDNFMASEAQLADIQHSITDIHRLALSHIVASDHATMIQVVAEIKEKEEELDKKLAAYESFVTKEDAGTYRSLLDCYDKFKHSLVCLVCASADSKTQEAYALANGDVAGWSTSAQESIDTLYSSVTSRAAAARSQLSIVYITALFVSAAALIVGVVLVMAASRIIRKYVVLPIQETLRTLQDSSERICDVVGEVRKRTQTSSGSVRKLSDLAQGLSGAIKEVAVNSSAINGNATSTQNDADDIVKECSAITSCSVDMRKRAEEIERSVQTNMNAVRSRMEEIMEVLNGAIEKSRSVEQINILTKDILSISSSTDLIAINATIEASRAGDAGKGFAVVAQEIRRLSDSCTETANHIQEVNAVVTGAVEYLSSSSQELADYLNHAILTQFEQFVQSGQQYRTDAVYIEQSMEAFNSRADHLRNAMTEIADSIASISSAIDSAASGVNGVAGSTRSLVDDMSDIAVRMDTNQEIVGELQRQMNVFANL